MKSLNGGSVMRAIIKTVFILCYIAFMWASIHKVAYFFGNFEADTGTSIGSYALAGAFDVTALVTTIGVMFFRKSMPWYVQWILWAFIIGIVAYTFFINWEYDAHFQGMALALQPTGATTPVLDKDGIVHYVPVMQQNTTLLFLNPLLASGFTVFALIYSVVAEFFGTKPPTAEELQTRIDYLKSVETLHDQIKTMEEKNRKPGLIALAKEKAIEAKKAVNEVKQSGNEQPQNHPQSEDDTLDKTVAFLTDNPQATDEMLAQYLGKKRPASARFWRLKAMEIVQQVPAKDMPAKPSDTAPSSAARRSEPETEELPKVGKQNSGNLREHNDETSDASSTSIDESIPREEEELSGESINMADASPDLVSLNLAPEIIEVLKRYPSVHASWLSKDVKSVTIDEIVMVTKQPKRRVQYQVGRALKKTPKNPNKILVGSVIEWLKTAPIPEQVAQHLHGQDDHQNGNGNGKSNGAFAEGNPLEYPTYQPS